MHRMQTGDASLTVKAQCSSGQANPQGYMTAIVMRVSPFKVCVVLTGNTHISLSLEKICAT